MRGHDDDRRGRRERPWPEATQCPVRPAGSRPGEETKSNDPRSCRAACRVLAQVTSAPERPNCASSRRASIKSSSTTKMSKPAKSIPVIPRNLTGPVDAYEGNSPGSTETKSRVQSRKSKVRSLWRAREVAASLPLRTSPEVCAMGSNDGDREMSPLPIFLKHLEQAVSPRSLRQRRLGPPERPSHRPQP